MVYNNLPRIVLRLANIIYSKNCLDSAREHNLFPTRRRVFPSNTIVINHGSTDRILFKRNARNCYVINKPEFIKYSSDKLQTYKLLKDFHPPTYTYSDRSKLKDNVEYIIKPRFGHQGRQMKYLNGLRAKIYLTPSKIAQVKMPIKYEFRFNVFDDKIYQISKKIKTRDIETGRCDFNWVSLGSNAKLHPNHFRFVRDIINEINSKLNHGLGSYAVDTMKTYDKKRYLVELNTSFGLGYYTSGRFYDIIRTKYFNGELEKYRVR